MIGFFKDFRTLSLVIWSLGATVGAHAEDGASGENGKGAGAPTIANESPLRGGEGGAGTDGDSGGAGGIGALVTGGGQSTNISTISGGAGGRGGDCDSSSCGEAGGPGVKAG